MGDDTNRRDLTLAITLLLAHPELLNNALESDLWLLLEKLESPK
jgi:hypothetical protein